MRRRLARWLGIAAVLLVIAGLAFVSLTGAGQSTGVTHAGAASSASLNSMNTTNAGAGVPRFDGATVAGLVLKFGVVVALLGASLWLLRRYAGSHTRGGGPGKAIQIVETIPLAQHRVLYVLDLGDRAVVIGATQQQFTALAEVTDETVLGRLRTAPERRAPRLPVSYDRLAALVPALHRKDTLVIGNERDATPATSTSSATPDSSNSGTSPEPGRKDAPGETESSTSDEPYRPLQWRGRRGPVQTPAAVTPQVAAHLRALAERLRSDESTS